jgi:membrane protease YdiL (CAAX protease family)
MVVLFVLLPLAFRLHLVPLAPIPALWILASYCLYRLLTDDEFNRKRLWNPRAFPDKILQILAIFSACALLVGAGVYLMIPHQLFDYVRRTPAFWAVLMVMYPILSVYPQGIVYRAFFFERYRGLFSNPRILIGMSAVAFSFAHIIFGNPIAVAFTLIGGVLFAWRYSATGSLLTSAFEHALYGCWMFTIGLGAYFYHGVH